MELLVGVEFRDEWAVHQHFFLYQLLSRRKVVSTNVVAFVDCSVTWALAIVFTRVSLGFRCVWSAFLLDEMAILCQEPVEYCPASGAPFV